MRMNTKILEKVQSKAATGLLILMSLGFAWTLRKFADYNFTESILVAILFAVIEIGLSIEFNIMTALKDITSDQDTESGG